MTNSQPPPLVYRKWAHELKSGRTLKRVWDRLDFQFDKMNESAVKSPILPSVQACLINGGTDDCRFSRLSGALRQRNSSPSHSFHA